MRPNHEMVISGNWMPVEFRNRGLLRLNRRH
jgi:hypothetical protein